MYQQWKEAFHVVFKEDHKCTNMAKTRVRCLDTSGTARDFIDTVQYRMGNRRRSGRSSQNKEEEGFQPPLDVTDGAALSDESCLTESTTELIS
jgi:hypothetical protein